MKIFKENDSFSLTRPVNGDVIGEHRKVVLPIGTIATIVLVHDDPNLPMACEIETHLSEQDCYVLATAEAPDI